MNADRKCGSWLRILPIIVAFILLFVVFRGLDFRVLTQTFAQMRVWCFVSAVALYGLLFLPAAWRWHLVLRSSDAAVSFGATLRASLIGHFFYTTFFGVIGGDSAKAVLYADRFGFSPASILATAPLDRLLGSIGALLFALLALGLGLEAGAFSHSDALRLQFPIRTILAVLLLIGVIMILVKCFGARQGWQRFRASLVQTARIVTRSPAILTIAIGCGFVVQLALSGVLACNLAAVSHQFIPWSQILWTFPLVITISALPVSVGGLGTREGAAIFLWGLYGIASPEAVAASLLTLVAALFWAAIGGLMMLVGETKRRASDWRAVSGRDAGIPQNPGVSVGKISSLHS